MVQRGADLDVQEQEVLVDYVAETYGPEGSADRE